MDGKMMNGLKNGLIINEPATPHGNGVPHGATICGAGGRPGQVVGRFGGHQRGGLPRNKSPEKVPGRRRRALDTDRWLVSGHTRMA